MIINLLWLFKHLILINQSIKIYNKIKNKYETLFFKKFSNSFEPLLPLCSIGYCPFLNKTNDG